MPVTPDNILAELEGHAKTANPLFKLLSANETLKQAQHKPEPLKIVGGLLRRGETAIFFGDTGVGKTMIAVQIALAAISHRTFLGLHTEAKIKKALLLDCELTDKMFQIRYTSDSGELYDFGPNFYRAEIDLSHAPDDTAQFQECILKSIRIAVIDHGFELVVIDNITWLNGNIERAKDAAPLMKSLFALSKELDITLIIISHTPKRDKSRPITENDISGSKMLSNFCDAAFAIGVSEKDDNIRYLKQVKVRNGIKEFGSKNVPTYIMGKEGGFTGFTQFLGFTKEREHLKEYTDKDREDKKSYVIELHNEGKSYTEIEEITGASRAAISKYVNSVHKEDK